MTRSRHRNNILCYWVLNHCFYFFVFTSSTAMLVGSGKFRTRFVRYSVLIVFFTHDAFANR